MPTYIQLIDFTEQGVENIEGAPDRVEDAKDLIASLGGEFTEFYLTLGQYDAVGIAEFPDDEAYTRFTLAMNRAGNGSTETLRAFPLEDFRDLVDGLPD